MKLKPLLLTALIGLAAAPAAMARDDDRGPQAARMTEVGWAGGAERGSGQDGGRGSWGSDRRGNSGGGGSRGWEGNRGSGGDRDGSNRGGGRGWDGGRRGDGGGQRDGARIRSDDGQGGWGSDRLGGSRRSPSFQGSPAIRPVEPAARGWTNNSSGGGHRSHSSNWSGDHRSWDGKHRWWDGKHRHNHYYPRHGYYSPGIPTYAYGTFYLGNRYWYDDGIWYSPYSSGYVVVRPPYGVVVTALPSYYTMLTLGGVTYYYANGVYYAPSPSGGYQVVAPPPEASTESTAAYQPPIVYPSLGQSPEKQAEDQYECHAWAVRQSGFDPTAAATGEGSSGDTVLSGNYARAFTACMEGRGYSVK